MFISCTIFHQTLAVLPMFFNEMSMGFAYGWVAPTLRQQQSTPTDFHFDNEQCSWIGSIHELGRIFGPFLASWLIDKVGRQKVLVSCTITFFAVWLPIIFTRSVAVLYAVRFVFGIAVGLNDVCGSIYIGENGSPNFRAVLGGISMAFFYGGELIEFMMATYLSYSIVAISNCIITFLALSSIFTATETPQFLIMEKNFEKAKKNFEWLQGKYDLDNRFEKLKTFVEKENSERVSLRDLCTNSVYYKPIVIIFIFCVLMMMTGFSAVTSFVSIAFGQSETLTPYQFTALFGFCQFVTVCVSPFFIEKFYRKTILIASFLSIAFINFATAFLYYILSRNFYIPYSDWFVFSGITLYAMIYSIGIHPIFYVIRGELFPQKIKATGGSIAIIGHSSVGFLFSKMFLPIAEKYGIYVNFLIFAMSGVTASFFIHKWLPETRGKTLSEIQHEMRNSQERKIG